ncbi:hypothetical protein DPEC_G00196700 [Dallia pectoralis]|uniref:Uncharacterized protein n=1 Tax=Dallia pectoralis TaxID=75939 RepID=A0ACC2G7Q8_DALPE|nr:hypothetical protein DPEC_G00196700 [Dallia pectoralis]
MASLQQEYPLVLLGILEELAAMRHWLSFQDLCRMVSTRFDLQHLMELRSLLFSAACRDSCFPATLFRDRVTPKGLGTSPIGVAADIVTIFNLIQMTGGAPEAQSAQPMDAQPAPDTDQSPGPSLQGSFLSTDQSSLSRRVRARTLSDSQTLSGPIDQSLLWPKSNYSFRKRSSLPPDPLSLVTTSPPGRARAVSFDWQHNTSLFSGSGSIPGQDMQTIYLPLETDSESSKDSLSEESGPMDPGSEPGSERHSCVEKRDIFKKDFHNQSQLVPQVTVSTESQTTRGAGGRGRLELFSNRSVELLSNPYPSPTAVRPSPERRAKHESLDNLQDSTYFGPGSTIPEWSPRHLQPPRKQRPGCADKSLSLDSVGLNGSESSLQRRLTPSPTNNPAAGGVSPPKGWEGSPGIGRGEAGLKACSTGTQTDTVPDPRRLRSLVHADRLSFMTSMDDPDMMGEDDISAIFRFLDDMSMCGSTGVLHTQDGGPSAGQDTPEARRGRLGQLQRLFHSLDGSDDGGLKSSVCKLLLRMGHIERRLESLSEVKAEISQVLAFLQRLDEKMQQQVTGPGGGDGGRGGGRWLGPSCGGGSSLGSLSHPLTPGSAGSSEPQPLSVSGHSFGSLDWNRWGSSQVKTELGDDLNETTEGKKGFLSRRASNKPEDKIGMDTKRPSIVSNLSARDWTVSFSRSKDGKEQPGDTGKTDLSNNLLPQKQSSLVGQVFSSSLFRQKGGGLTNPALSSRLPSESRLAEGRGGTPVWTVEERESRISPLDLQAQESMNPNNLDFWMEDIYTPGYNTLLRRKEADQRRARACKLGALIFTAVTIILVIVIPIAAMKGLPDTVNEDVTPGHNDRLHRDAVSRTAPWPLDIVLKRTRRDMESIVMNLHNQFQSLSDHAEMLNEGIEPQFIQMALNFEDCRRKWLQREEELGACREVLTKTETERGSLEVKLKHARNQVDVEIRRRQRAEADYEKLERQIQLIRDLLVAESSSSSVHLSEEQRSALAFLNAHSQAAQAARNNPDLNTSRRLTTIDESASLLSDISYDKTEDSLDWDSSVMKTVRLRKRQKRRSSRNLLEPPQQVVKKPRSTGRPSDRMNDSVVAKTTITMPVNGGPVQAVSTVQMVPGYWTRSRRTTAAHGSDTTTTVDQSESNTDAPGSPPPTKTPRAKVGGQKHEFHGKTVIKSEACVPCGRKTKFGKLYLRCQNCRLVAHPECRDRCPLPCHPVSNVSTPVRNKEPSCLVDFAPSSSPMVPALVIRCVKEIELRGLREAGLYRVSGEGRIVKDLKERFLRGREVPALDRVEDIHCVTGLLKDFLRSLPEPLLTFRLNRAFMEAAEIQDDGNSQAMMYQTISELPLPNRDTLAYLAIHLQRVAQCVLDTKMDITNLSRVFGPTLVGHAVPDPDPMTILNDTHRQPRVMERLLDVPYEYWNQFTVEQQGCSDNRVKDNCSDSPHHKVSMLGPVTTPEHQMTKTPSSSSLSQRMKQTLSSTSIFGSKSKASSSSSRQGGFFASPQLKVVLLLRRLLHQ